jgi:class 3 adenylate cyclase/tetratricopeptide (TPR) repeat protein
LLDAYVPIDRRQALLAGRDLPSRASGAILCADVSGFTPLAEVLARELGPRRGADVLSARLNLAYGALIDGVHRYGGSVIGFSGDAITCWFEGDDGRRATTCALALQQIAGHLGKSDVHPTFPTRLAIKVAVAAGSVRRLLVGDPEIQTIDVLAGATVGCVARAEKQAAQGEVVVAGSGLCARLRDQFDVLDRRGDITVVAGCPGGKDPTSPSAHLSSVPDPLPEQLARRWILRPVHEKLRAGSGQFLAELRPTVALFLSFGGLAYDRDDAAGDKLDTYVRWVQGALARHGGYLIQLTCGDERSYLYAAFGAPLAHGENATRAVAAALALRSPPREADFVTDVAIGISRGLTWTGAYGGPTRRTYGVLGDEVNVAARLMEQAKPGQILLSERAANAVSGDYSLEPVGSLALKGKRDAVPTYALTGRRPAWQGPPPSTYPLVGRDRELAHLEQMLEAALAREGRVLRLEGAAGIGKSRLAAAFVARALERGFRVAVGACQSVCQDIPHHPWRQILHALFGIAGGVRDEEDPAASAARQIARVQAIITEANPDWLVRLPLLGDLLNLPIPDNETTAGFGPLLRRESLLALTVEIIRTWARPQPLLLLIEDAHWMDEASREMAMALGRAIGNVPLLLVLVHRPPGHGEQQLLPELDRLPYHSRMLLQELSPQAVAALLADRLRDRLTPLALSLIVALAQGNPFLAEELMNALRESGDLCREQDGAWALSERLHHILRESSCLLRGGEGWTLAEDARLSDVALGIPESIHGVVLSRVDRLPEAHRMTLKVASVIGHSFELDLLASAHPARIDQQTLLDHLAALEAGDFARLVTREPLLTYAFKHNITQEVTYRALVEEQRRELHRAVGQAMEAVDPTAVERLAHHYSCSGSRDKALFYLDKAAHKAQGEYANDTALNYYNQALALEERWEWLKGKVEVLHILGRREEEAVTLRALEADRAASFLDTALLWAQYYESMGQYPQARHWIEQALDIYQRPGEAVGQARCLTQLGWIAGRQGDYRSAQRSYRRALWLFSEQGGCADEKAHALNGLGAIYGMWGRYGEAVDCLEQVLSLSRARGNRIEEAQALNNLGIVAFYRCEFSRAAAYHQQALEIRRAVGDRTGEGCSLVNLAQATRDAGDYSRASECLLQALAIHQATGNRWAEGSTRNELGILALLTGNLPEARDHLHHGLELSQRIGDESGQAYILCNLGQVWRDLGDVEAAEKALTDSMALAKEQEDKYLLSLCLSHLGRVHLRTGAPRQAQVQAAQALELRRELALRLWMTADLATLAAAHLALKDQEAALSFARQALTILDDCNGQGPEYPEWDYFLCHQVLAAAGEQAAARQALESAYQLVMTQSTKITDPAMRQSFLERVPHNREIVETYASLSGAT